MKATGRVFAADRVKHTYPSPLKRTPPSHAARYMRECAAFVDAWQAAGLGPLEAPVDDCTPLAPAFTTALQRVLGRTERFPKPVFLAARRFQSVRDS